MLHLEILKDEYIIAIISGIQYSLPFVLYWVCMARVCKWKGYKGGFCEKLLKASPMSMEPMPASCKTAPPLAKVKPISDHGSAFGLAGLRRGKKNCGGTAVERGVRLHERNNSADTPVSAEGGEEVLQALEQRFPAAHEADHGEAGCPCSHGGPRGSRSPPAARGGPQAGSGGAWRRLWPCGEPHAGAGSWQDLWPRGGPKVEQPVPEGWHPMEGTHAGAVCAELQPMGRTHVEEVGGGWSPVGGTPHWTRGRVWRGRSGRDVWWTDHNPHSPSPCATRGEEVEKIWSKVKPGKKGELREGALRFSFTSHYPTLIWLVIN